MPAFEPMSPSEECQQFRELQLDVTVDPNRFAAAVTRLRTFADKFALARKVYDRGRTCTGDAVQIAFTNVHHYLADTRGSSFRGTTDDELGGWFYCLARQHLRWAVANLERAERRRRHHEEAAGRMHECYVQIDPQLARRAKLIEAVLRLPTLLRRVVAAYLRGEDVAETTKRLGISRRTYFRLKSEAIRRLRSILGDDDDAQSDTVRL